MRTPLTSRGRRSPLLAAIRLSLHADRRSTLLTFLSFSLRPSIPIVVVYLMKVIVDSAVAGDTTTLVVTAIAAAICGGLSFGSVSWAIELNTKMIEATSTAVDERLVRLTARLPGIAHLDRPELLDDLEVLRQERVHLSEGADAFSLVLGAGFRAVITGVILAMLNPVLLLTPLLAVPALVVSRRGQRRRVEAVRSGAARSRLARHLYDVGSEPGAAKELRIFGSADALRNRFNRTAAAADRTVTRAVSRNIVPTVLAGLFLAGGYLGALLLMVRQYSQNSASLGDLVLTLSLVTWITLQVSQAVVFLAFLNETISASRRLLGFEDYVNEAERGQGGDLQPPRSLERGVRLEGVGFQYPGSQKWALRDVTLEIPAGSVVAVIGANGAGKSTLIKLLTGLYQPMTGRIVVDDIDLADTVPGSWYEQTSACFQDFARLQFTVGRSVGLGDLPHVEDRDRIATAVRQGAAADLVDGLADGLDTPLGRSLPGGVELSGGQWQRMALARARMRQQPCLLVLDEPTASIDPLAEDTILRKYLAAARQTVERGNGITLFASHRMSTARSADMIIVVADGRIAEMGHHRELSVREGGIYQDLYRRQAEAYE